MLKRVFDILCSASVLLIFLPVPVLTGLCIWLDTPGPVVFRQERVGYRGEPFTIFKFRTFDEDEITRMGLWLRKYRLDEWLQLFNVLLGHMSLVGPRPLVPAEVEINRKADPLYETRHDVLPGITGLAQTRKWGREMNQTGASLRHDRFYIERRNFALDLFILFLTCRTVLWRGEGV